MSRKQLPPFAPVSLTELRQIWTDYPNKDIRRLTLEVERYHRMFAELDQLYSSVHQAWRDNVGGDLVALHLMKQIVFAERQRRAV